MENTSKPKLMWKYLKELLPGNAKPSPKGLLIDGQIITDPKCMSNIFNNYCTSIGQELASKLPPAPPFIPPETTEIPAFTFPSVSSEFLQKQLQNMPEPLDYIFNLSLQSGKSISEWKYFLFSNLHLHFKQTIIDPFLFNLLYKNYWNVLCIVVSVNTLKSIIS